MLQGVAERVAAWDAEQGESLSYQGFVYFKNGAHRELNPMGALHEPPQDDWERAKRVALYFKLVFDRASAAFTSRKRAMTGNLRGALNYSGRCAEPPDQDRTVQELEDLRDEARRAHRDYLRAREAVEEAKPFELREREADDADCRQSTEALLSKLSDIDL